jgi:hypothetical protein
MEMVDNIAGRRHFYEQPGLPFDDTTEVREDPESFFIRPGLPANPNKP